MYKKDSKLLLFEDLTLAQLVEHKTVIEKRHLGVPGSIPGGEIIFYLFEVR